VNATAGYRTPTSKLFIIRTHSTFLDEPYFVEPLTEPAYFQVVEEAVCPLIVLSENIKMDIWPMFQLL
jgi:hypothetical protein